MAEDKSKCKHEKIQDAVQLAVASSDGEGFIVDVWCDTCGRSGSLTIRPAAVQWGKDDDDDDEEPEEPTPEAG